jgi:hypothetical protein
MNETEFHIYVCKETDLKQNDRKPESTRRSSICRIFKQMRIFINFMSMNSTNKKE